MYYNGIDFKRLNNRSNKKGSIYKRPEHVRDFYDNLQAIKIPKISDTIYDDVKDYMHRNNIKLENVTEYHIRKCFRALGLPRLYEYTPLFLCYIRKDTKNPYKPLSLPKTLVETHKKLFLEVQEVYHLACPEGRSNFFNLNFLAHKLCGLLKDHKYKHLFRLPRTQKALLENEKTWKRICEIKGWDYESQY